MKQVTNVSSPTASCSWKRTQTQAWVEQRSRSPVICCLSWMCQNLGHDSFLGLVAGAANVGTTADLWQSGPSVGDPTGHCGSHEHVYGPMDRTCISRKHRAPLLHLEPLVRNVFGARLRPSPLSSKARSLKSFLSGPSSWVLLPSPGNADHCWKRAGLGASACA